MGDTDAGIEGKPPALLRRRMGGSLSLEELSSLYDNENRRPEGPDQNVCPDLREIPESLAPIVHCVNNNGQDIPDPIEEDNEKSYKLECDVDVAVSDVREQTFRRDLHSHDQTKVNFPEEADKIQDDNMNNCVVIRNPEHSTQCTTFSFGLDGKAPRSLRHVSVIDVVNHYKPDELRFTGTHSTRSSLENGIFAAYKGIRGHVGGDTTASSYYGTSDYTCPQFELVNTIKHPQSSSQTGLEFCRSEKLPYRKNLGYRTLGRNAVLSSDSDSDTCKSTEESGRGLFEVPLAVCAMPRLVDPFKGFSKICTPKAIRLLHFSKVGGKMICSLERVAEKLLQMQVKNLKVVTVSVCGDPGSGKSYLSTLLVNGSLKSFRISDSPKNFGDFVNSKPYSPEGTVWVYVAIYQEEYAYLFLDFDGFENTSSDRMTMLSFSMLISNCVICNLINPPIFGLRDFVQAMINVTKSNCSGNSEAGLTDLEEKASKSDKKSYMLDRIDAFDKYVDEFEQCTSHDRSYSDSDKKSSDRDTLWNAPIIHFLFRDSEGLIKCLDERLFTPETLVEQGIFDRYANIFSSGYNKSSSKFKSDMMDAFEVFTSRKYTSLPFPVGEGIGISKNDTHSEKSDIFFYRNMAENAKGALKYLFTNLLIPPNNDFMKDHMSEKPVKGNLANLFGGDKPDLSFLPTNILSNRFFERLDEVKSCVYQDTLSHSQLCSRFTGRVFVHYLKLLISHFNKHGCLTVGDVAGILSKAYVKENEYIGQDAIIHFLKSIKLSVVSQMPMEPKELLNRCLNAKHKSLQYFSDRAFGPRQKYRRMEGSIEKSIDRLIAKLETKNENIVEASAKAIFRKWKEAMQEKIKHKKDYTPDDLALDISMIERISEKKYKWYPGIAKDLLSYISHDLFKMLNGFGHGIPSSAPRIETEHRTLGKPTLSVNKKSNDGGSSGAPKNAEKKSATEEIKVPARSVITTLVLS